MSETSRGSPALAVVFAILCSLMGGPAVAKCRGMSVRDMISVTEFLSPYYGGGGGVRVSPDGKYALVVTQVGDVSRDVVSDRLLVWSLGDISRWLLRGQAGERRPNPLLRIVVRSANRFQGGVVPTGLIRDVRWAADSRKIFFRARMPGVRAFGLYQSSLGGGEELLSAPDQDVVNYDVRGGNVVYEAAVATAVVREKRAAAEDARPYFVGTGEPLYRLLFPRSWLGGATDWVTIWRISQGRRTRVPLRSQGSELSDDRHVLRVSPDGRFAVMDLPVAYVPREWAEYGKAGYPVWPHVGEVHLAARNMWVPHQFTLIDLRSGRMWPAVAAPDGFSRMFFNFWLPGERGGPLVSAGVSWARDGTAVLLRNTFVTYDRASHRHRDGWGIKRPCLALVDVEASRAICVENLMSGLGRWTLMRARWSASDDDMVVLVGKNRAGMEQVKFCVHPQSRAWVKQCGRALRLQSGSKEETRSLRLWVTQSLNSPPRLMASAGKGGGRVLYDPNAQLRRKCLGTARSITVRIGHGERLRLGLLLPVNYVPGRLYPLVIQTHGYEPREFLSAGVAGAFAARAFAAAGIAVLQVPECPSISGAVAQGAATSLSGTPDELSCNVQIFRAGLRYVVRHGVVDPSRVGIIGFSKTSEYVLAALERNGIHFAAAELIDGDLGTYTQYVAQIGMFQGYIDIWEEAMIGAPPIGAGLAKWIAKSPGFAIDKVRAPVLIQADGREGVLEMWEPYAILRKLGRPVDLVVVQSGTHPFSNPVQRLASEGMSVDWFRFWLQNRRPAGEAEYQRWSALRNMVGERGQNAGVADERAVPADSNGEAQTTRSGAGTGF